MDFAHFRISRRTLEIGTALVALVSVALVGAHAALNKRAEPGKAVAASAGERGPDQPGRIALVIGNSRYPDAAAPLLQPINDARAISEVLRGEGFDVDMIEDARRDDLTAAVDRLQARATPNSVVMVYFGGYGVQAGRESYMLPVDATIWKESDVRRQGVSIESVLAMLSERGAQAKLAVIDASRRNPYERRFRSYSHGLGAISAPANALVLTSATPGRVADDVDGPHSLLASELLTNLNSGETSAEQVFGRVRSAVSRASAGEQVPTVSSSLTSDVALRMPRQARAGS
jgi:uncharacterized caspase-like protein